MNSVIHLVGRGSQGRAWDECLRRTGRQVLVYHRGNSASLPSGLSSRSRDQVQIVVLACADDAIASVYNEHLRSVDAPLLCVLLHGFAVYSGSLPKTALASNHALALLAPKAIGPELRTEFFEHFPHPHDLKAALHLEANSELLRETFREALSTLARDLGFATHNLIPATFEKETVGDLISEQGLLCGGVFTLLDATLERMMDAGVPPRLAREECFKELELIAKMLTSKGFSPTFQAISAAAKAGTVRMRELLEKFPARSAIHQASQEILNKEFVTFFENNRWKPLAAELAARFEKWDKKLEESPK